MDAANREAERGGAWQRCAGAYRDLSGCPGAFSYEACGQAEPDLYAVPCTSFEEVLISVREGCAERAVIPIENSTFGRVADIHRLLPNSGLHIVARATAYKITVPSISYLGSHR